MKNIKPISVFSEKDQQLITKCNDCVSYTDLHYADCFHYKNFYIVLANMMDPETDGKVPFVSSTDWDIKNQDKNPLIRDITIITKFYRTADKAIKDKKTLKDNLTDGVDFPSLYFAKRIYRYFKKMP